MPYVAKNGAWVMDSVQNTVKAGTLYEPVGRVLDAGIVTLGAFSATAQSFTNLATYLWNSGVLNTQGQRWVGVSGTDSDGCRNEATPRTISSSRYNHIQEFEMLYTGQALDIAFIAGSYYEVAVFVEYNGQMHPAEANPKTGTTTGLMHLPLNFAAAYHGRIRVHLTGGLFVGIKCEQSAIVKKSPDRIYCVIDGSEWAEGAGIKQASGVSYQLHGLAWYLFEKTGFVWAYRSQPDTGWFGNGSLAVTSDTPNSANCTRYFSQNRKDWLEADWAEKPLIFLITGSRTDGANSGATGFSGGPMDLRVRSCLAWLRTKDRYCRVIQLSTAPFDAGGSGLSGPPALGSAYDLNHIEQKIALATQLKTAFIDAFSPLVKWWNTAQQPQFIGADGVRPNDAGFNYWANKIALAVAEQPVYGLRARRIK